MAKRQRDYLDDVLDGYVRGDIKFEDAMRAFDQAERADRLERELKEAAAKKNRGGWQPFVSVSITFSDD